MDVKPKPKSGENSVRLRSEAHVDIQHHSRCAAGSHSTLAEPNGQVAMHADADDAVLRTKKVRFLRIGENNRDNRE